MEPTPGPGAHELSGIVVVVTGGAQGLGRAYSHAFGRRGSSVAVADLNLTGAQRVAEEIKRAGGNAAAFGVDVSDPRSVDEMAGAVLAKLGSPTVLVNNAAIFSSIEMRPFTEIPIDEWDRVMAVNVRGVWLCSRALVPGMAEQGYGKIINISSAVVWIGRPNYLHYVASKAAVIGMTRALANEVGPAGIRVNAVTPGATLTEIPRKTLTTDQREEIIRRTPLRRGEVPEDLVGVILFLASAASDFITGQTINVDGGVAFH